MVVLINTNIKLLIFLYETENCETLVNEVTNDEWSVIIIWLKIYSNFGDNIVTFDVNNDEYFNII